MESWDYSSIGFSCPKGSETLVRALLSCMGVDFQTRFPSRAGCIHPRFREVVDIGVNHRDCVREASLSRHRPHSHRNYTPEECFTIVNQLFAPTTLFYEYEQGCDDNCSRYRYEEIYDPGTNLILIGLREYSEDDDTVFGVSVYEVLKADCEQAAKKAGIDILWTREHRRLCPGGDAFWNLCRDVLQDRGGLSGIATRKRTQEIPAVDITREMVAPLLERARDRGCTELAALLRSAFCSNHPFSP